MQVACKGNIIRAPWNCNKVYRIYLYSMKNVPLVGLREGTRKTRYTKSSNINTDDILLKACMYIGVGESYKI